MSALPDLLLRMQFFSLINVLKMFQVKLVGVDGKMFTIRKKVLSLKRNKNGMMNKTMYSAHCLQCNHLECRTVERQKGNQLGCRKVTTRSRFVELNIISILLKLQSPKAQHLKCGLVKG